MVSKSMNCFSLLTGVKKVRNLDLQTRKNLNPKANPGYLYNYKRT